jgi:N6-adenosine-specific RNA methylase IME4
MQIDTALMRQLPWALRIELTENLERKPYTQEELARIERRIIGLLAPHRGGARSFAPEAPTQKAFPVAPSDAEEPTPASIPPAEPDTITAKVAKLFGESDKQVRKRIEVVEAAEAEPAKYGPLVEAMNRSGKVNAAHKQLQKQRMAERIAAEPEPLPDGPFRVIVVDPPWPYEKRPEDLSQRAALPYPALTIADLCALPVADLAHEDCLLWLWTTNAHMHDAFHVLDAWGFTQKTILTWVMDSFGAGDWLRGQTEHCLLAVRGKPTVLGGSSSTVITAPRREHSRKPEAFYQLVETVCPGHSTVELFARQRRPGWTAWGAEQEAFDAS